MGITCCWSTHFLRFSSYSLTRRMPNLFQTMRGLFVVRGPVGEGPGATGQPARLTLLSGGVCSESQSGLWPDDFLQDRSAGDQNSATLSERPTAPLDFLLFIDCKYSFRKIQHRWFSNWHKSCERQPAQSEF